MMLSKGWMEGVEPHMIVPSAMHNIETVWEWLSDQTTALIVINGKPGSGKTWTAKHVMDKANASGLFDFIVWADLANNILPDDMLHIFLVQLKLHGERHNEDVSTEKLREHISVALAKKRYLLILDGILSLDSFNLEAMGVPFPKEQNRSSKVLITGPRSLTQYIAADRVQTLDRFSEDEAWLLFKKISSFDVDSPHRDNLLKPWLEDCNGLPSEIVNLGESLNMTSAANILNTKAFTDLLLKRSHLEEFLHQIIPTKDVRECFLYCIMFPSNHRLSMKRLIMSWVLEGFLDGAKTSEEAYDRGHHILQDLIDQHFLFRYDDNHVKINYLLKVREFGFMSVQAIKRHSLMNENLRTIITEELTLKKGLTDDQAESPSSHGQRWELCEKWIVDKSIRRIGINGETGSGKTWIAKQLMERALDKYHYNLFIWVDLKIKEFTWKEVKQIVPRVTYEEKTEELDSWELSRRLKGEKFMMVIDGVPSVRSTILDNICSYLVSSDIHEHSKLLVTGSKSSIAMLPLQMDRSLNVEGFSEEDSWLLFQEKTGLGVPREDIRRLVEPFLKKCNGLPSKIVELGESAKVRSSSGFSKSKTYFELQHYAEDLDEKLHSQLFPSRDARECFSYCTLYPPNHRISVMLLITCWILEGFLDGFGVLDIAYERGLKIIKELLDHELLSESEDGYVELNFLLNDRYIGSYTGNEIFISKCILPGRTVQEPAEFSVMNESLQIMYCSNVRESLRITSLFLYGNEGCIPHQLPDLVLEEKQHLQVLALFRLGISSLPVSLLNLKVLQVLVVKDCGSLKSVDEIAELQDLKVLSLSGATSVTQLPDDFFHDMDSIEYLDLSGTRILHLPISFSNLFELETLILRECSLIQKLPSLEYFEKLTSLDLSGTSSLREIPRAPINLEILNLSGSLVENIPSLRNLHRLRYLFLRDCSTIKTLPHIDFGRLRELSLSGARAFREFVGSKASVWHSGDLTELDLSRTQIAELPFLSGLSCLRKLLLRSCLNLKAMPSLKDVDKLEVLDLSSSTSFEKFQDGSLGHQLRYLDLSATLIENLPTFSAEANLVQLLLRGCNDLKQLPTLELQKLRVLDLSGCTNFSEFYDESLEKLRSLQSLNLSGTQVSKLPTLSKCSHLRQITLSSCVKLKTLPSVEPLERLELLDLSGATSFKQFLDDSLGKKRDFRELILSYTQVVHVPLLSECHNLRKLVLRGCSKLQLPNLVSLVRLEVLDLSESQLVEFSFLSVCTNLRHLILRDCPQIQHLPPLKELVRLMILDLSQTNITDFSFLSGCNALCQLLLRNCPNFKNLPPLKEHTQLEVLDLSGTNIADTYFLSGCYNVSKLSVRGCPNLKILSCEGMCNLQEVDLSKTPIEVLQSTFQELRNLRQLLLKDCSSLTILPSLEVLNQLKFLDFQCSTTEDGASKRSYLRFIGTRNGNYSWGFDNVKSLSRFHICLFIPKGHLKENEIYLQAERYSFKDKYYQTYNIPVSTEEPDKFFKISGFEALPVGIEEVLSDTEVLYLRNNDFVKRLSDLGATNVKSMKDCWIESCDKMETVFCGAEKEVNVVLGGCLQNLWISKLSQLKCLFRMAVQSDSFTCLRHIYIECCPRVTTIFCSHMMLKSLEMLKIKFCDELEDIFGEMGTSEDSFPKLKTMTLWKLPKLRSICGGVLPAIEVVTVKGCPKLERLPVMVNSTGRTSKMKAEMLWWNNVKMKEEIVRSKLSFKELQT